MNPILKQLQNNVFFYCSGSLYRITQSGLHSIEHETFTRAFMPILVLSREHVTEYQKKYPITDKADLKAVIKQECDDTTFYLSPETVEQHSTVKFCKPDKAVLNRFGNKVFFWLPESAFHLHNQENRLVCVERCGSGIFSINRSGLSYLVCRKGNYANKAYFLMSVGESDAEELVFSENEYSQHILDSLLNTLKTQWKPILAAQGLLKKAAENINYLSVGTGIFAGITLFFVSQITYLHFQTENIKQAISEQKAASYVSKRQQILDKREAFLTFAGQDTGQNIETQLWSVIGHLVGQRVSVVRFSTTDTGIWLRLESKVATETLQFIKSLPLVKTASITNAVSKVRGKQRFNVNIQFADPAIEKVDAAQGDA